MRDGQREGQRGRTVGWSLPQSLLSCRTSPDWLSLQEENERL